MASTQICLIGLLSVSFFVACLAADSNNILDFCVADIYSHVFVNGAPCKDPKTAHADDFYFTGLDKQGNFSNPMGSKATPVYVQQIPGLNTLGLSMVRLDFAPDGLNPPHTHPRASEIITVLEGTLEVGFIGTAPDYRHFSKILNKGDVFVFPMGLLHYQRNVGKVNAVAIAALNSQNPGTSSIAPALFTSKPVLNDEIISKTFLFDKKNVAILRSKFN